MLVDKEGSRKQEKDKYYIKEESVEERQENRPDE